MKNETLKKHHFWILLGFVPLFVLIAVLVISSSVGGAIAEKDAAIDKAAKEIATKTNPKPAPLIKKLGETNEFIASKKGDLWKVNWERQKDLFTWPNSNRLKAIEKMGLKFGQKIPNNDAQYNEFTREEIYLAEYSTARPGFPGTGMADKVAPTQFNGGWQRVLRHVNKRSEIQLTSDQIWLMLEDIWVQRSLLDAIRSVNEQMAEFKRVKFEKNGQVIDDPANPSTQDPLRRKFRSPTWELELEVVDRDNKKVMIGRLTNITDRLQLMGVGNVMRLNVWLQPGTDGKGKGVEPFEFRIGGESLKGVGALRDDGKTPANFIDIAPLPDQPLKDYPNVIPVGKEVVELVRVEQVFDTRTVPVRRIETIVLGYRDSRTAATTLLPPKFMEPKDGATTTTTTTTAPPGGGAGSSAGFPDGDRPGDSNPNSGATASSTLTGGGTVASVIDANKNRYLVVNDQVRRMPVAIVLVVDQAHIQDVLMAFVNSPLRFQITQVTWKRFRDNLDTGGAGGGSASPEGYVPSGPGQFGEGLDAGGDPDERRGGGSALGPPGGIGGPPPGMGPGVPPKGGSGSGSGLIGLAPGGPLSTGGSPAPGGGGIPSAPYSPYSQGGGSLTTFSESQLTSGLVELSIYGVVSLYEKYTPPADSADAAAKDKDKDQEKGKDPTGMGGEPTETKDKDNKDKDDPKDKDSKEPMTTPSTTPKMRVRRRVR